MVSKRATTIDEAHFLLLRSLFEHGSIYTIDKGSYEGHKRLEFDFATMEILHPGTRPLAPTLPAGIPPVTDEESIEKYFVNYIMNTTLAPNEIYRYSTYISPQVPRIIDMFKSHGPGTNQATISVGGIESTAQEHPPCLRVLDFRMKDNKLHVFVYFRSWDCWGGLPENLGGIQLLKEYIAAEIGCEDGEIVAMSKGLHMYDFQWPVAYLRLNSCLPDKCVLTVDEILLGEGWMQDGQ